MPGTTFPVPPATIEIPFRKDIIAAAALMIYCVSAIHELSHHATGALICRAGKMSLDLFIAGSGCPYSILVSAIGPMVNYALGWLGAYLIHAGRHRLLGVGIVVASMPLVRYFGILTGGNDEGMIARALLDRDAARVVAPVVAGLLVLPPAILAAFALDKRLRWPSWMLMMVGPLAILLPKRWVDRQFFAEWMQNPAAMLPNIGGVPVSVLVIHALMIGTLATIILLTRPKTEIKRLPPATSR